MKELGSHINNIMFMNIPLEVDLQLDITFYETIDVRFHRATGRSFMNNISSVLSGTARKTTLRPGKESLRLSDSIELVRVEFEEGLGKELVVSYLYPLDRIFKPFSSVFNEN